MSNNWVSKQYHHYTNLPPYENLLKKYERFTEFFEGYPIGLMQKYSIYQINYN